MMTIAILLTARIFLKKRFPLLIERVDILVRSKLGIQLPGGKKNTRIKNLQRM